MQNRPPSRPDPEVLPESVAERLLARASELDVARGAGSAVVDLRAAAAEAGISAGAFDAALAELQGNQKARLPDVRERPRRRWRMWRLTAAVAALIAAGAYSVSRRQAAAGEAALPRAPIVEEAILLRCLAAGDAAELIRPLLPLRSNSIVYSTAHAPRLLTIRATPVQLLTVKAMLDKYEGAGSPACAPRPTATVTP
ncbi:MAG: hypothetical protein H0T48_13260 [Gemmatimonadaceae bacterium]|nr:hypothetical protein [Gemmatimonadaceae bacterium]